MRFRTDEGNSGFPGPFTCVVTATGGPFGNSSVSQTVKLDSENVKVDFIAPLSPASVGEPSQTESIVSISPNPASGQSHIHFVLPASEYVSLNIFNALGENVQSLALGNLSSGSNDYLLDLSKLPTGSYTYQLHEGEQIETGRIVVLK